MINIYNMCILCITNTHIYLLYYEHVLHIHIIQHTLYIISEHVYSCMCYLSITYLNLNLLIYKMRVTISNSKISLKIKLVI